MKALPKRKGNVGLSRGREENRRLNESPSEKEGKSPFASRLLAAAAPASMKALPKRKGNLEVRISSLLHLCLNESPSEKEGKWCAKETRLVPAHAPQ